jgi:amino acid transporter/nucleotide-binding universal stress UspA family protein
MIPTNVKRPRNVDWKRAAAILYGDWGTSKAYVIGLAFAVAGYSSFWLIAPMCVLTALVGANYMVICRLYPDGGGVYASVRHRSEVISIVGAFLLIADYLVTAAISALSAFAYLGVPHPEKFAALAILIIGILNLLGPRHTGGLAFLISVPTVLVVIALGAFSIPHLGNAWQNLQPLHGSLSKNWAGFVGIVLALSGVEAIANATGVMKLDPGSTEANPRVTKTSTPAILIVMIEVCIFTALLGLAMHALSGLTIVNGDVNAPGAEGVRDYMLRYMGQVFGGGAAFGHAFGFVISIVFGLLLLSAVNTAIVDLITIQFLMSRDREIPKIFQRLNRWGVPGFGMALATIVPMLLVVFVKDMAGLADLYAVGVVGAIATNLGATATDRKLSIKAWERALMFTTFIVMAGIEMSLLIDKPNARYFAVTILAVGLILRGLVLERRMKREVPTLFGAVPERLKINVTQAKTERSVSADGEAVLCAIRSAGRTLDFSLREAGKFGSRLYLLFVREQPFMTEQDVGRKWQEDAEASEIFAEAKRKAGNVTPLFCYAVSPSAAETIVDVAATLGASRVILGAPQRNALINLLRGNVIREVSNSLPEEIDLLVYA